MAQKMNGGYMLTDEITIKGQTYVMGYNPAESAPYVTWAEGAAGGYFYGNYFTSESAARQNLFERAAQELSEEEKGNLAVSLLGEDGINDIIKQGKEQEQLGSIEFFLGVVADNIGLSDSSVNALMADGIFRTKALHLYQYVDPNDFLDSFAELIQEEFPHVLNPEQNTTPPLDAVISDAAAKRDGKATVSDHIAPDFSR